jgi:hypothetical protein
LRHLAAQDEHRQRPGNQPPEWKTPAAAAAAAWNTIITELENPTSTATNPAATADREKEALCHCARISG